RELAARPPAAIAAGAAVLGIGLIRDDWADAHAVATLGPRPANTVAATLGVLRTAVARAAVAVFTANLIGRPARRRLGPANPDEPQRTGRNASEEASPGMGSHE